MATTKYVRLCPRPAERKPNGMLCTTFGFGDKFPDKVIEFQTLDQLKAMTIDFAREVGFEGKFANGISIYHQLPTVNRVKHRKPPGFDAACKQVEYFWPTEAVTFPFCKKHQREYDPEKFDGKCSQCWSEAQPKVAPTPPEPDQTLEDADPGAIFCWSWGYEQTNINFYQVVRRNGESVWVREVEAQSVPGSDTGGMSDKVAAVKDAFKPEACGATIEGMECRRGPGAAIHGESGGTFDHSYEPKHGSNTERKTLKFSQGKLYLVKEYGWCSLWNGKPHHRSWYA